LSNFAELKSEPFVRKNIISYVYNYVQNHNYVYFQNIQTGSIISKIKGILDGYDSVFSNLHHKIGSYFWWTLFPIIGLFFVNFTIGIFVLVWAILFAIVMYPMTKKLNYYSNIVGEQKHYIFGILSDNITNIFTLFAFASRNKEYKKLENTIENGFVKAQITSYKYDLKFSIFAEILYYPMFAFVFFFMLQCKKKGIVTSGDFAFILSMVTMTISFNLWKLIEGMADFMKEMGDFKSSFSIMQVPQDKIDKPNSVELKVLKGEIVFKNLQFHYDNNNEIFKNLNLKIDAFEKVGIVGSSGAGKSTLISLLLKNFAASSGDIIIDKQSIYDVTSDSIRSQISLIPQEIMLFHRTIGGNIGYATDDATIEKVIEAAKMANIHDFIESLPEKYDTLVGERGIKLSGGQRQRIAIARAILKNAPILILDEATSALDTQTEQEIQKSISAMLEVKNATVIAIAHRLSTIKHMGRIIVLENGQIVEDGAFNVLLDIQGGKFKKMWDQQVNGMIV